MKNATNNFGRIAGKIWTNLNIYVTQSKNILNKKNKIKKK